MSETFLKPFIPRPGVLNPVPGDPLGYCTKDGMWAAIPLGNTKKFAVIHNGGQIKVCPNYKTAIQFILKKRKTNVRNKQT
tara:strand:- start:5935 stop:6174 length:240 start_codon:yes stop_codon:yes gene_type:complete